ncbi:Calcium-dependent secretion activator [Dirofilaria immitis]|nr:Calcium-dependent secretion activator [Dirofilaria immitis]
MMGRKELTTSKGSIHTSTMDFGKCLQGYYINLKLRGSAILNVVYDERTIQMLGASSSEEDDDDNLINDNDDASEILCLRRHQFPLSSSPRSMSPAPSDSASQANSLHRGDSLHTKRKDSGASYGAMVFKTSHSRQVASQLIAKPIFNQSSQEISDDEDDFASNEQSTPAHAITDSTAEISKEEEEK